MSDTLAVGLIGHWRFTGNLDDSSGNNKNLINVSGALSFATDKDGVLNSCLGGGSGCGLNEKLILNSDNEPFSFTIWFEKNTESTLQVLIGISRINSTNGERKTKIKALSVNLKKDKLVSEFEEVETSAIKSISSLDPTNYLTDKTILNATYTNDFGEVYTSTQNVSKVLSINGNEVEISTVAVDLDTEEIILSIRDQFFDMVSLENGINSVSAILLGDLSSIEVGDSVYIYKKSITSKSSEISYISARGKDKLYLEWNCSTAYDYSSITVFEVDDYTKAIAEGKTATINISNFKGSKIIVGAGRDVDLAIQQDKYYVIKIVLFDLDGKEIDDGKITIYSPNSTKTIKGVV